MKAGCDNNLCKTYIPLAMMQNLNILGSTLIEYVYDTHSIIINILLF